MADDARISTALPKHPKTVKLRRRLGVDGCWSLICLFLWVSDNRPSGDLSGMTDEDIEIAADWNGEPGTFIATLAEVRFVDGEPGPTESTTGPNITPMLPTVPSALHKQKRQRRPGGGGKKNRMRSAYTPDANRMRSACEPTKTAMPSSPLRHSPLHMTPQKLLARRQAPRHRRTPRHLFRP